MPLHCAATRPKFFNVPSLFFSKPCDLLTRDTSESNITFLNDFFVFFRLLYSTLVSTSYGTFGDKKTFAFDPRTASKMFSLHKHIDLTLGPNKTNEGIEKHRTVR